MARRTHKHRDRVLLWFLLSALSLVLQVLGERNLCESYDAVTSLPVQLHSPGFPSAIPVGPTQCSCSFRLLDPAEAGHVIKVLVNKFIVGSYVSINVTSGSGQVLWQRTAGDEPAVLQLRKDDLLAGGLDDTLVLTINSSNPSPSGLFTLDITDSSTHEPDRAQVQVTCSGNRFTTTPAVTPTPPAVPGRTDMAANETTSTTTQRYTPNLDGSDMSRTANIAGAAGGGSVALLILVVGVTMWRRQRPRGGPQAHELGRRSNRSSKQNSSSRRTASEPSHTSGGGGRGEAMTHAKRGHSSVENSIEDTDPFIPRFSLDESSFEVKDNSLLARYTAGGIPTAQTRDVGIRHDVSDVEGKPLQVTVVVESPPRGQHHRGVSPVQLSVDDVSVGDTSFDQSHHASPSAGKSRIKNGSVSSDSGIDSTSATDHRHKLGKSHREHRNPDAVHSIV